jgi:predicted  nucleic acid-binding Zn-ribbon protein
MMFEKLEDCPQCGNRQIQYDAQRCDRCGWDRFKPFKSRAEHIEWAKARALEYTAEGRYLPHAMASFVSDLGKHPATAGMLAAEDVLAMTNTAIQGDAAAMRRWIEAFAY